jgi:hypothetical protein
MAQDPGLYVPMSKVTPKMTGSSQSKITTTSNNWYTKMLLLVVGDIGYPEVVQNDIPSLQKDLYASPSAGKQLKVQADHILMFAVKVRT